MERQSQPKEKHYYWWVLLTLSVLVFDIYLGIHQAY